MRAVLSVWVVAVAFGGCGDSATAPDAEDVAVLDSLSGTDASAVPEDVELSPSDASTGDQNDAPELDVQPPQGPLGYEACSEATRTGGFQVTLAEEYTAVSGLVLNGIVPGNVPEEVQVEGSCRLLRARSLYCDPGCVPGETCGDQGACVPYPESISVGTVTVDGLKEPLSMDAKWGNNYTNPGSMVHPGYVPGAELSLAADGGDYEAFVLRGVGVEALSVPNATMTVVAGEPLNLSWSPAAVDGPAKVHIELNLNNHGATSAWISCDVDDTGSFGVSASLLDALQQIGVSGFPSLSLARRSSDHTTISVGCVEFIVASSRDVAVEIEGVKSCTSDQQCPPGQSCGVDLACH